MKVALLVSGQVRLHRAWDAIQTNIISPFNADVFLSSWDEGPAHDIQKVIPFQAVTLFCPQTIERLKLELLPSCPGNKLYFQEGIASANSIVSPDNLIRQFFLNFEGNKIIPEGYSHIVKIRPDLSLNSVPIFTDRISYPYTSRAVCNDQMFYGPALQMRTVLDAFTYLSEYVQIDPMLTDPEDFLKSWVIKNKIEFVATSLQVQTDRQFSPEKVKALWPRRKPRK